MRIRTLHIKILTYFLVIATLGLSSVRAQLPGAVRFKGGTYRPQRNFGPMRLQHDSLRTVLYKKKYYVLVQFDKLPDSVQKLEMAALGLRLFDYVPDRAYLAELPDSFPTMHLDKYAVTSIFQMPKAYKIASRLQTHPEEVLGDHDQVIAISYFGNLPEEEVKEGIRSTGAVIVPQKIQPPHTLFVRVENADVLQKLAALPYVSYIAAQPVRPRKLNYNNRGAHGAGALGASSGRNLQGDGITVGVGDDSSPYTHVDFTGRLIDRNSYTVNLHGTLTSGIVGGGGILDQRNEGMAPHSTIVNQFFSDILTNSPAYYSDYNMQLTSNSYTDYAFGCQYEGEYDALSTYTDFQLFSNPYLMHIFASGNDGVLSCGLYPTRFATVKSGFQSAKNAICVGNIDNTNPGGPPLDNYSSAGPVNDGRLKPEIVAGGSAVISTAPYNNYVQEWGTSLSCPTVAGTMALMVQRYRQLKGTNPYGMLLKALVCNTANDMGNPGPDYQFGFGGLNGRAAVECMENNQYVINSIGNGQNLSGTWTVPAGMQQVRFMLYWPDYPAAAFSSSALVNNLDLTVTDASGTIHHPLILKSDPAHVNDAATEGTDSINNIEQVVVNVPAGGVFNINIKGTKVPAGPQPFVLTWQYIQPGVVVEFPSGNERMLPNEQQIIRWNAYGGDPNTFKAEFSADGGSSWQLIQDNISSDLRELIWHPSNITNQGLVRISRNNTSYSALSKYPFTVLTAPVVSVSNPCRGYAQLDWPAVASADSFDIMQLKGSTMQKVGNTTGNTYLLKGLNPDSSYWLAVRSVYKDTAGRRSIAVSVQPSGGACTLSAMDNDYTVDSLVGLRSGRLNTSTQLSNSTPIRIDLKNLGSVATSTSFNLCYSINSGIPVVEPVSLILAGQSGTIYTFTHTADLSAPGVDTLRMWVTYPGDPNASNDTLTTVIKQLKNDPVILNTFFTEDFETAARGEYFSPTMGFTGNDRCDFYASNDNGRARTLVNPGFSRSGVRAVTLDQTHNAPVTTADSLILTFNLSNYGPADQLFLDFYYKNQGNDSVRTANKVWIRGSDQDAWIEAYTLDISPANIGVYQHSSPIDITGLFKAASPAQVPSSSFQVKFGEEGYTSSNNVVVDIGSPDEGYTFDDVNLSRSTNDIGITALISPSPGSFCSLSSAEHITFKVKNYTSSAATNIPVTFSINGSTFTETIPSINGNDSINYTFAQPVNLSAYGYYTFTGWVRMTGDNYSANDTLQPVTIHSSPLVSSIPIPRRFREQQWRLVCRGRQQQLAMGRTDKNDHQQGGQWQQSLGDQPDRKL